MRVRALPLALLCAHAAFAAHPHGFGHGAMASGGSAAGASASGASAAGGGAAPMHSGHPVPLGYLGIDVRSVNDDEVTTLHLHDSRGAEIIRVDHDGPAGKMGLREHDVVLQMNGTTIEGEEQMRHMLRDCPPGRMVTLLISRDGQLLTLAAAMADKAEVERQAWAMHLSGSHPAALPPGPQAPSNALPTGEAAGGGGGPDPSPAAMPPSRYGRGFLGTLLTSASYTGAIMETMSPQLAQFFGVSSGSGLLVRSVVDSSPAGRAGMHAGDVVLRANAHGILTMGDWARVIKDAKGHPVIVVVLRDRAERTLTMIPDGKRRSGLDPGLNPGLDSGLDAGPNPGVTSGPGLTPEPAS